MTRVRPLLDFWKRQIGYDALTILAAVNDDLIGVFQDFLHTLQIQPFGGYRLVALIGFINQQEPLGFTLGFLDQLFAVGRCLLHKPGGLTLRLRQNIIRVGIGLVLLAFPVLFRTLNVIERIDDRCGRFNFL